MLPKTKRCERRRRVIIRKKLHNFHKSQRIKRRNHERDPREITGKTTYTTADFVEML